MVFGLYRKNEAIWFFYKLFYKEKFEKMSEEG